MQPSRFTANIGGAVNSHVRAATAVRLSEVADRDRRKSDPHHRPQDAARGFRPRFSEKNDKMPEWGLISNLIDGPPPTTKEKK